jgi:pyruvate,water dikinase
MEYENYAHLWFNSEEDLDRQPYWLYNAGHTAPGHPKSPMFESFWTKHCTWGFRYASEKLSLPWALSLDTRSINGYEYVRLCLTPSEEEARKRAEKFKEAIRPFIEDYDKIWPETVNKVMGVCEKFKKYDYKRASWWDLMVLFKELMDMDRECFWETHMLFFQGLGQVYQLFEDLCRELLKIDDASPEFQKLITGFDNRSNETSRRLFKLSRRADELGLRDTFLGNKPEEVTRILEQSDAGKQWLKEFQGFLETDGWRMPLAMDFISPTWLEDPSQPILYVQQFLNIGDTFEMDEIRERQAEERKKAEQEVLSKVPGEQRDWFVTLMKSAQNYAIWSEDHNFYLDQTIWSLCRWVIIQIGKRLAAAGTIEKPDDMLFLVADEVNKALVYPEGTSLKGTVRRRRAMWEEWAKMPPTFPILGNATLEQVSADIVKSRDSVFIGAIGKRALPRPELKADLLGISGSSGIAEGTARVLLTPGEISQIKAGEILVANFTYTTWTPAFAIIRAAVVDQGGTLSHAAITGREYGIPVVVNCLEGTQKIKTGQKIRVDGNTGAVYILNK